VSEQLSDEQAQVLMDSIIQQCEEMDLLPEQILDGLGRSLMSAANAFDKKQVTVTIADFGTCKVVLD